jgi:hypothetical protein
MTMRLVGLTLAAMLAGCEGGTAAKDAAQAACVRQPGAPAVPTMAFQDYLATRPTPDEFRARFSEITLVMPGDAATRDLRLDCSRFFGNTGEDGHVVSGRFG